MHIITIFIWFILYSILGWIYETIFCSIKELKWDNRGMTMGPYCPIYGVGAVLDVLLCRKLPNGVAVFLVCMFGSAVLEYMTSYLTEKLFHAVWWDYSALPLNINGRICLPCSLGFGIAGMIILYVIHPYMVSFTDLIPLYWQELLALLLMAGFATDCALTTDSLLAINVKLEAVIKIMDLHISEKYDAFIKNTRQNISDGRDSIKEIMSLEEFRERRMGKEFKKTLASMNWRQKRALRSIVVFRRGRYSKMVGKMKHMFYARSQQKDSEEVTEEQQDI